MRRGADPAVLFLASAAVFGAATSAKWTVLSVRLVDDLGFEPYQLALLGTALELAVLLGEIPTGVVADVVSRRLSIVLSFLVVGPAMALAGVFESFWLVALTQVGWGIGWTLQSGADVAWVTDELGSGARIDRLLVTRAKVQLAAHAGGVPLALLLNTVTTRTGAIVLASGAIALWGLVLALVMPERGFTRAPGATAGEFRRVVALGGRLTLRTPALRTLAVVTMVAGMASEALDRLDVARLVEVGIPDDIDEVVLVGGVLLARSAAGFVLLRLVERRTIQHRAAMMLSRLHIATAVAVVAVAAVDLLPVVAVALVAQSALRHGADPFVTMIANAHDRPDARATVLSFISQANAMGEIAGGVALGALASATSLTTAFTVAVALFLLAGLQAPRITRESRPA